MRSVTVSQPLFWYLVQTIRHSPRTGLHKLSENLEGASKFCQLRHKLIGFYNGDEKCLLPGTDWGFK